MTEQQSEKGSHGATGREPRSLPPPVETEPPALPERGVTIYGIRIRGSEHYVYVGATTNLKARRHTGYSADAIATVLSGAEWDMFPLEECRLSQQVEREAYWIEKLSGEGHMLANAAAPIPIRALPVAPASRSGTTWGDAEYAAAGYGRLSLRLPARDLEQIDVLAKQANVTRSALLAQWIQQAWSERK